MMPKTMHTERRRARTMLLLATLLWGTSFPVMKAMGMLQASLLGHEDSWFATASGVAVRFGVAAICVAGWCGRSCWGMTPLEAWQGLGLGCCAGVGMLLQVDGLAYTSASTSAFLTQGSCLILPWAVAFRDRRWPSSLIVLCSVCAAAGVAVLADLNWRTLHLGRGEVETLLGSVVFSAQILWLERPVFSGNRVSHFTLVMFATMTLVALPLACLTARTPQDWQLAYSSGAVLALTAALVVLCTLIAFVLMNRWQPLLSAPEAGLAYAAEPLFAAVFALFLPQWLSGLAGIHYPNEQPTFRLILGGGLITLANLLVQIRAGLQSNVAAVVSLPSPGGDAVVRSTRGAPESLGTVRRGESGRSKN